MGFHQALRNGLSSLWGPKDQGEDRLRLVQFELKKQPCDRIEIKRYRCAATVLINDQSVKDQTGAEAAIYTHNSREWLFASAE